MPEQQISWFLTIHAGPNAGYTYPLPAAGEISIGRQNNNQIVIEHPLVSRRHAKLIKQGNTFVLEDQASANGVFVNGRRVTGPVRLQNGDMIGLGDEVRLIFENSPNADRTMIGSAPGAAIMPAYTRPAEVAAPAKAEKSGFFLMSMGGIVGLLLVAALIIGGGAIYFFSLNNQPTPTATALAILPATDTPSPTATLTPTTAPTATPYPTYTPYPTTAPTATPYPTYTPYPTDAPTATPYPTYTPYPTDAPTATPYPTYTAVRPAGSPAIITQFIADQYRLGKNDCTMLRWTVSNAKQVKLDGNAVANQGTQQICSSSAAAGAGVYTAKIYSLIAVGTDGQAVVASLNMEFNIDGSGSVTQPGTGGSAPYVLQVGGQHRYEEPWGGDRGDPCEAWRTGNFDDKNPNFRGFNVELLLSNYSNAKIADDWGENMRFYTAGGRTVSACYYGYSGAGPMPNGQTSLTFFTVVPKGDYVQVMELKLGGYTLRLCLDGRGGSRAC